MSVVTGRNATDPFPILISNAYARHWTAMDRHTESFSSENTIKRDIYCSFVRLVCVVVTNDSTMKWLFPSQVMYLRLVEPATRHWHKLHGLFRISDRHTSWLNSDQLLNWRIVSYTRRAVRDTMFLVGNTFLHDQTNTLVRPFSWHFFKRCYNGTTTWNIQNGTGDVLCFNNPQA